MEMAALVSRRQQSGHEGPSAVEDIPCIANFKIAIIGSIFQQWIHSNVIGMSIGLGSR